MAESQPHPQWNAAFSPPGLNLTNMVGSWRPCETRKHHCDAWRAELELRMAGSLWMSMNSCTIPKPTCIFRAPMKTKTLPLSADIKSPQFEHESYIWIMNNKPHPPGYKSNFLLLRCAGKSGIMWLGEMTSEDDTCLKRLLIYQSMCKYDIQNVESQQNINIQWNLTIWHIFA